MQSGVHYKAHLFGAYCAVAYVVLVFAGWGLLSGFLLPPMSPMTDELAVMDHINSDLTMFRLGMIMVMFSALFFLFFAGVLSHYLAKVEGGFGFLSGTCLLGAAGNMVLTFYPAIWWLTAAYRPERSSDLVYLFNDMSWLQLIGGVSIYLAMPISVAMACFASNGSYFPRWLGYFNVAVVFLILPDQLIFFFHSGPFAWNGIFGLWIPVVMFGSWFLVHFWVLRKIILKESGNFKTKV